ncbi:MAG: 2Fe-2S iron-sulfur cluster-binding protein [Candidatus Pacearchaeota archaeon]|jgi:ferredoxin
MPSLKRQNKIIKLKKNSLIDKASEELGIPFSCHQGTCGICVINLKKGEKNLSPLTKNEKIMGMNKNIRLACQCKIKNGDVEIE